MKRIKEIAVITGWPGLVTIFSVLAAWTAILQTLSNNPKLAIVFATLAFQLDVLDGYLARKLNRTSEFGRQLDSLSDLVNYSLLAALVTSQYLLSGWLGYLVSFCILVFGILRLALFNVRGFHEEDETLYYRGIITCHLSLAALVFYLIDRLLPVRDWLYWPYLIALSLLVLAVLQISQIKVRKSGVLIFWIPVSIMLAVGSLLWL